MTDEPVLPADDVRGGVCADCWEKHDPYYHVDLDSLYARDEEDEAGEPDA